MLIQCQKKADSLVIGISGGIDSSVSSTLSAMTGLKTIVLSMPINQKDTQHDLSLRHQEWLKKNFKNVQGHTLELDSLFKTLYKISKTTNGLAFPICGSSYTVGPQTYIPIFFSLIGINFSFLLPKLFVK